MGFSFLRWKLDRSIHAGGNVSFRGKSGCVVCERHRGGNSSAQLRTFVRKWTSHEKNRGLCRSAPTQLYLRSAGHGSHGWKLWWLACIVFLKSPRCKYSNPSFCMMMQTVVRPSALFSFHSITNKKTFRYR